MKFSSINIEERKKLELRAGDTVRVLQKIQEKEKTRLQAFEGLVIARRHGSEPGATFTVRRIVSGIGVEKIFPLYSPVIDKIEIVRRAKVRRAKLYYIRKKTAKQIRRKMKGFAEFIPVSYQEGIAEDDDSPLPETTEEQSNNDDNNETKEKIEA